VKNAEFRKHNAEVRMQKTEFRSLKLERESKAGLEPTQIEEPA